MPCKLKHLFLVFFLSISLFGEAENIDSLLSILPKTNDTTKINTLLKITEYYFRHGEIAEAKLFCERAIELSKQESDSAFLAASYYRMGSWIYNSVGDFSKALEVLLESYRLLENTSNKKKQWGVTNAIGNTYHGQKNFDKALEFYNRAFEIGLEEKSNFLMSKSLIGRGNVFTSEKKYEEALETFLQALSGFDKNKNQYEYAMSQINIGNIYVFKNENEKALKILKEAYEVMKELDNKYGIGQTLQTMGTAYQQMHNYEMALISYSRGLNAFIPISAKYDIEECYKQMAKTYNKQGRNDSAYHYMQLYSDIKDSLYTEESTKQIAEMQTKYESVKKEEENKSLLALNELSKTKIEEQSRLQIGLALFLGTAFVFSFFLFRSNKQKQKKNQIISRQKEEVELQRTELQLKNKEITDSITYAKRIQQAILPSNKLIKEYFADGFIYYKPKDIVAGDFYWIEKKDDLILFAAADCTGHGVPGAMVSVVCNNALNRALREFNLTDPGELLDKTREFVIAQFEKSEEDVKDGMDISLCVLNTKTYELRWAGANNPLWVLKNGEFVEIKADKQPIGKHIKISPFTTREIQLHKNDLVYVFSDGYADQFGGVSGKKYKYKQLQDLLLANAFMPMQEQKKIIENSFTNWMGYNEQVDDILVMGVRI